MIHQYKLGGYNIVLDVCSGSVHVVDDAAYDIIALMDSGIEGREEICARLSRKHPNLPAGEVSECLDQVVSLKEAGKLFAPDVFEPMAGELKPRASGVVKALCLHVAHTCNLNCAYCFASQGKYHGERAVISFEVGRQALDFLVAHSGTRRNLEVDFFGGEPLMNFDVVKRLVAYARSIEKEKGKNFRFTLTTNGMLVDDDVIDFANRECHNVVLSLDGRKAIHDACRVDYAGNGSWERIVPKFQRFVEKRGGKGYYMRGTFTHANPDFLEDIKCMLDLGFDQLSMEPVVCPEGDPAALTAEAADDPAPPGGPALHLLPLHDRPGRRALRLQAHLRLRQRHRIHGRHPLGRSVSLPSVRGRDGVPAGGRLAGRHQRSCPGGVRRLQRLRPPRVPGLLGAAVLLRRLRRQRLARHRQRHRRLPVRLRAVQEAHGVCHHGGDRPGAGL